MDAALGYRPLHSPEGGFQVLFYGAVKTNFGVMTASKFIETYKGKDVQLALVRRDGMRLFVDEAEVPMVVSPSTTSFPWNTFAFNRFAHCLDPSVTAVALINSAADAEELAFASKVPPARLAESILGRNTLANDAVLGTNELAYADGVTAELMTRPSDPSTRWLRVRRESGPGFVAVRRLLPNLESRIRGPMRASFTAWNPANEPLILAVTLDGGNPYLVEIQGRSELAVNAPVRAPHSQSPRVLDIYLADEDGNAVTDVPSGKHFALRELRLQTDGAVFVRTLDQQPKLTDLSDRMSGRGEIYANARRMADDYIWWGSGAGTFTALYQFYLQPGQTWAAYAHHDWLETRITFGRVGLALIALALGLLFVRSWIGRGLPIFPILLAFWWLALGGCLTHAIFDFPFQVHSVLFLFTVLAAVLLVLTGARRR